MVNQTTPSATDVASNLEALKRKSALSDIYCFSARVEQPYESEEIGKESKKPYDAVNLPVSVLSRKGTNFARKRPIYSREGKMIIDNAPYDETAIYQITVDNSGKYPEWVSIEKVED